MEETVFSVDVYTSFVWPYTWHYIINYCVVVNKQIPSTRAVIHGVKIKLHDIKWINQSFYCNKADLDTIIKLVNRANKICKLCALKNEDEKLLMLNKLTKLKALLRLQNMKYD